MREQRGWLARSFSLVLILASPTKARTRPRACVGRLPIKSGHIVSAGFPVQHSGCAVYVFFLILFLFLLLSPRMSVCVLSLLFRRRLLPVFLLCIFGGTTQSTTATRLSVYKWKRASRIAFQSTLDFGANRIIRCVYVTQLPIHPKG